MDIGVFMCNLENERRRKRKGHYPLDLGRYLLQVYEHLIYEHQNYGKCSRLVCETFENGNTITFLTKLLSDREGEFADLDHFVSLHRRTAGYRAQSSSRLERKH